MKVGVKVGVKVGLKVTSTRRHMANRVSPSQWGEEAGTPRLCGCRGAGLGTCGDVR